MFERDNKNTVITKDQGMTTTGFDPGCIQEKIH